MDTRTHTIPGIYRINLPRTELRSADGVARLAAAGIVVRRGRGEDGPAVQAHTARLWPEVWAQETATALHVHVNTLRHRLDRVEQLTGRDLGSMEDRVDLYIALRSRP